MTRWTVVTGAVLAVILGTVFVLGTRLPESHSTTVTAVFPVSVETLWTAATDHRGYALWRSGVDAVERLPDMDGHVAWAETGSAGPITMMIEESSAPTRYVIRIADVEAQRAFGGTWTFTFREEGTGARLSITEDGEIYNPLFRFIARHIVGHDRTLRRFLDELDVYLQEATFPTEQPLGS